MAPQDRLRDEIAAHLAKVGPRTIMQVADELDERPEQVATALGTLSGEGRTRRLEGDGRDLFEAA